RSTFQVGAADHQSALSVENAILIVEFAESAVDEGYSLSRAAIRAAQTRRSTFQVGAADHQSALSVENAILIVEFAESAVDE
ncbi:hypothetical protein CJ738_35615, partial [Klebsiella pneumoniae]